jgi:bifunctional non-homologous end joining protein LigD
VTLHTRYRHDFTDRFPLAAAAVAKLPARSCLIDGQAIACDESELAVFDMIRYRRHDHAVTLCAFDLLELDGEDLRRMPIETRKLTLKHFVADGASVYRQACALGCEGIVSKRLGSCARV